MAKDLPYFKFNAAEYLNGDITLEDFYVQGVFANICAYYWFKSGCLTLPEIKRRVKCKDSAFTTLIESGIIKVDGEAIRISFLDEQLAERGNISKINAINGSKGGAPIGNKNAQKDKQETTEKQPKTTNIEERREEEKREEKEEKPLRAYPVPFVNGCLVAWEEWEKHRKEIKKKITPQTAKKQIQFLGGRPENEIIAIINQSITNGWTGLFEIKDNGNNIRKPKESLRRADATVESGKPFGAF